MMLYGEEGDTIEDILNDPGARDTLVAALTMYRQVVSQTSETATDNALVGTCALQLANIGWILEVLGIPED